LNADGLSGIEVPAWQAPPADPIAWRSIARIDGIESGARKWGIIGFVVGGAAGLVAGSAIGESRRHEVVVPYGIETSGQGGIGAIIGLAALGSLGAWQGSRFGAQRTHDRVWYVAAPLMASATVSAPAMVAQDTTTAAADSTTAALPPAPSPPATIPRTADDSLAARLAESRGVKSAVARIDPLDLIRMRADFGQFQGHLAVVGPLGVEGFRPDRKGEHYRKGSTPIGLVGWDQIDHVEKRGNSAGRGALIGLVSLGIMGGIAGAGVDAGFGGDNPAGAAVYGAGLMGGIGMVLGGLIGAAFPAWHVVYDGP
jgi:hypothetical protein